MLLRPRAWASSILGFKTRNQAKDDAFSTLLSYTAVDMVHLHTGRCDSGNERGGLHVATQRKRRRLRWSIREQPNRAYRGRTQTRQKRRQLQKGCYDYGHFGSERACMMTKKKRVCDYHLLLVTLFYFSCLCFSSLSLFLLEVFNSEALCQLCSLPLLIR